MRMQHLYPPKTSTILCLGRMTYFLKYKELQRRGECDVWESYLNLNSKVDLFEYEEMRNTIKIMEGLLEFVMTLIQS